MRYLVGLSIIVLVIWLLQNTGMLTTFAVFLMVGAVPGTSISISPLYMLGLSAFLMVLLGYFLGRQHMARRPRKTAATPAAEPQAQVVIHKTPAKKEASKQFAPAYHQSYSRSKLIAARQRQHFGVVLGVLRRGAVAGLRTALNGLSLSLRWLARQAGLQTKLLIKASAQTGRAFWQELVALTPRIKQFMVQASRYLLSLIKRAYDSVERAWLWLRTND